MNKGTNTATTNYQSGNITGDILTAREKLSTCVLEAVTGTFTGPVVFEKGLQTTTNQKTITIGHVNFPTIQSGVDSATGTHAGCLKIKLMKKTYEESVRIQKLSSNADFSEDGDLGFIIEGAGLTELTGTSYMHGALQTKTGPNLGTRPSEGTTDGTVTLSNVGTVITVEVEGGNPDFVLAGAAVGNEVTIRDDSGDWYDRTILAVLDNTITISGAAVAVGGDKTMLIFQPCTTCVPSDFGGSGFVVEGCGVTFSGIRFKIDPSVQDFVFAGVLGLRGATIRFKDCVFDDRTYTAFSPVQTYYDCTIIGGPANLDDLNTCIGGIVMVGQSYNCVIQGGYWNWADVGFCALYSENSSNQYIQGYQSFDSTFACLGEQNCYIKIRQRSYYDGGFIAVASVKDGSVEINGSSHIVKNAYIAYVAVLGGDSYADNTSDIQIINCFAGFSCIEQGRWYLEAPVVYSGTPFDILSQYGSKVVTLDSGILNGPLDGRIGNYPGTLNGTRVHEESGLLGLVWEQLALDGTTAAGPLEMVFEPGFTDTEFGSKIGVGKRMCVMSQSAHAHTIELLPTTNVNLILPSSLNLWPSGLDGTYFLLDSANGDEWYIWFNLDAGSADPSPGPANSVEIPIVSADYSGLGGNDRRLVLADTIRTTLAGDGGFTGDFIVTGGGSAVVIIDITTGTVLPIRAGTIGAGPGDTTNFPADPGTSLFIWADVQGASPAFYGCGFSGETVAEFAGSDPYEELIDFFVLNKDRVIVKAAKGVAPPAP